MRYHDLKMEKFYHMQITKVVLFAPLFSNLISGMAIIYLFEGNDLNLISIPKIFILLFVNISPIGDFAILDVSDRLGKLRQIFSNVGLSLVKIDISFSSIDIQGSRHTLSV